MDAFLKKVIAEREREQADERALIQFKRPQCQRCSEYLKGEASHTGSTTKLCTRCSKEAP